MEGPAFVPPRPASHAGAPGVPASGVEQKLRRRLPGGASPPGELDAPALEDEITLRLIATGFLQLADRALNTADALNMLGSGATRRTPGALIPYPSALQRSINPLTLACLRRGALQARTVHSPFAGWV